MDENSTNLTNINLDDFIQIYPPISDNISFNSSLSNKFIKFFSITVLNRKSSSIQINGSRRLRNSISYVDKNNIKYSKKNDYNDYINGKNNFSSLRKSTNDFKNEKNTNVEYSEYILLNKAIEFQNKNKKRTNDIKNALSLFFIQSDLISKLTDFFRKYGIDKENENLNNNKVNNKENSIKVTGKDILIENKIHAIIQKLLECAKIEKYLTNDYIIRINEIGKQCYFLISGRLSILKPAFYKNIKISYENYFKYLLSLLNNKEIELAKQIIELNKEFINAFSITNLLEIIKVYCLVKIRNNIKSLDENKMFNINKVENTLSQFNLSLKDYNLNKGEIMININKIIEDNDLHTNSKTNKRIVDYFLKITTPSKQDLFIMKTYNYIFKSNNENNNEQSFRASTVTLGKYEIFLYLNPGAFFGETALENENSRRNASIRAEEDCYVASLDSEIYNAFFLEENKKLKIKEINFICSNFFFENISQFIFNKYYYPMLKLINKEKNDIIFLQNTKISSIFLLKEGSIKYEISASILEINQTIKTLIESLIKNKKNFKIENETLNDIRNKYLLDKKMFNIRNQNKILNAELRKKYKYEISSCEKYDTMGIIEFFINTKCLHSCYAGSQEVQLYEINRDSLEKILNIERDILSSYYSLIYNKIISTIKRLNSIEKNFINQIEDKINSNFYSEISPECDENKIKDNIFNTDILSLPPDYENYGFCENSILVSKKKFFSPIKFSNIKKNYFIKTKLKKKVKLMASLNQDNKKIFSNIKPLILKSINNINVTNCYNPINSAVNPTKEFKTMKKSLSFGHNFSIIKKKDDNIILNNIKKRDTLINVGKSTLTLKNLKKQILKKNEEIIENFKNSINPFKSSLEPSIDSNLNNFNNIFLKRLNKNIFKLKNKKEKYNINIYMKENKIENESFPIISNVKKQKQKTKSTLNKIKSSYYDINNSIKDFFENEINKNENILSKYIKRFYKNRKNSGYIGLVNLQNNKYIKKNN